MSKLDKIAVSASPVNGDIYLYRYGKDCRDAIEAVPAEAMVYSAVIHNLMYDSPAGASKEVAINGVWYEITVKPLNQ